MAASLNDITMQQKRKVNELEDITNNNRHHGKKAKMNKRKSYYKSDEESHITEQPQQQRSPSPSEASPSSPPAIRSKSVLFDFSCDKAYESSPLLTPKNDDDYDDEGNISIEDCLNSKQEFLRRLAENLDYIALTSSLRLLHTTKNNIENDISRLSDMLESYSKCGDKDTLVDFYMKLINNEMDLPKPHKVINSPMVDWKRYHPRLKNVNTDLENSKHEGSLFKTLSLFNSK